MMRLVSMGLTAEGQVRYYKVRVRVRISVRARLLDRVYLRSWMPMLVALLT